MITQLNLQVGAICGSVGLIRGASSTRLENWIVNIEIELEISLADHR